MNATSQSIAETIASLDRTVSELEGKARELSLRAVEGDGEARRDLADILSRIERATADRVVLENAASAALERERDAGREADEAEKVRHMGEARAHAGRLIETAARADALISAFKLALGDLQETERAVWTSVRAAGAAPSDTLHGRHKLDGLAVDRMLWTLKGFDRLRPNEPSIADRAKVAWSYLIADDTAETEA